MKISPFRLVVLAFISLTLLVFRPFYVGYIEGALGIFPDDSEAKPFTYNHQIPVDHPVYVPQNNPSPQPEKPAIASKALMPSQSFTLRNLAFHKVLVRSEYPVTVVMGNCHASNVVEWRCDTEPADIFVTDDRRVHIFTAPHSNVVQVVATRN